MNSIDWLEVIQTIASCLTVLAAFIAINTWKHQAKAQKQTDFLDELTDSVHEYIQALSRPCECLKNARIGFSSYCNTIGTSYGSLEQGAVAYIKARGEGDAKRMWEFLEPSSRLIAKINALVAKGQIYGFSGYEGCVNAVKMLTWQQGRLQVVATMLGDAHLNWENTEVKGMLSKMFAITPEDIAIHQNENEVKFLDLCAPTTRKYTPAFNNSLKARRP